MDSEGLPIYVQPRASRTSVVGLHGEAVKIRVAAPPVDGAANAELVRFLAKTLGVARSSVDVVSGTRGRRKLVRVDGMQPATIRSALLQAGGRVGTSLDS